MEKKLTRLSSESDRKVLRSQFEKEYSRLQDILVRYLSKWSKNIFTPLISHRTSCSNALVHANSAIDKRSNYLPIKLAGNKIYSIHSIEDWVKRQRQMLVAMLQEKSPEQFLKIENLLKSCFSEIELLVESQLEDYKNMIDKVRRNQFDCEEASRKAESKLTTLVYCFRKSALLLHPDKSFGNEKLQEIQEELFKALQELSKKSLKKIKEALPILENCLSKQRDIQECWKMKQEFDLRTVEMERQIEEMMAEWEQDKIRWKQDFSERKAALKKTRMEMEEMQVKINDCIQSQARAKLIKKPPSNDLVQEDLVQEEDEAQTNLQSLLYVKTRLPRYTAIF